jgi:hypothetical protein
VLCLLIADSVGQNDVYLFDHRHPAPLLRRPIDAQRRLSKTEVPHIGGRVSGGRSHRRFQCNRKWSAAARASVSKFGGEVVVEEHE